MMEKCVHKTCEPGKWAQCATCYARKGRLERYLYRYLGVPLEAKITKYPHRKILNGIKKTRIGTKYRHGAKSVTVTKELKGMVNFALNMNPV